MSEQPIRVGILGLGRSGWGIHRRVMAGIGDRFRIVAVTDALPERLSRSAAEIGCRAYRNVRALLADPEVEMVVVSTFNHLHAPHALRALAAGKHVLCEKPFGLTTADVDAMSAAAAKAGKVLAPFQQRRYERDFNKVKEIIDSGLLGRIVHVRTCWQSFKRRWDWQTTRRRAGGALNNNGPHPLDHAVALFGEDVEPEVWADAGCYLCSGDAEDHLKFILYGKNHPTVEVELTDVWAYPQDRWTVAGTRGGLRGNEKRLEWRWIEMEKLAPRPLDLQPTPDRSYNSEKLEWQTDAWEPSGAVQAGGAGAAPPPDAVLALYTDLYGAIRHGTPLRVTPESVRRRVRVMEKIRAAAGIAVGG
ncbi:MAG: Gfo/Idh/MocA family oxidoreductase [Lentisphaeria bacterium]|nr:Gfo/Idh/MocA family oxidoreductase [Lentisphaeria bacterium]